MAIKYYKKFSPRTPVRFGPHNVLFPTLDNITGFYASDNANAQSILDGYIAAQQYGLTEISQEEYNASYLEKKKNGIASPTRQFREELGATGLRSGSQARALADTAAAAAVVRAPDGKIGRMKQSLSISDSADAQAYAPAASSQSPAAPESPVSPITPTLGKRPV